VKAGARITATTSLIVAITLGSYAIYNLYAQDRERRDQILAQARDMAANLGAVIQSQGVDDALALADTIAKTMTDAGSAWRVALLDASLASEAAPSAQIDRLAKLLRVRPDELTSQVGDTFYYAVPLAVPAPDAPDGLEVIGALELSRSIAHLDRQFRADLVSTAATLAVILGLMVLAIVMSTRLFVTRPVEKLIAGIDDVAQGDLSRVLLSERDDEVGALAARFNAMTGSLRESRAETERQNRARIGLEQRLSHTEKLATIGQLAAEIAHEVGTPLNVIAGRARAMAKRANEPDAVAKNAAIIAEQTSRITRIIHRLLDITRKKIGAIEPQEINLNEIALTTMEFLEGQFASTRVRTTLIRAEGLPRVQGDPDRLQQVLLNLLINATQAMPEGGTLRVETSVADRQRPGLDAAPHQSFVKLAVADSGPGIPLEARDKIFDPFYTSKDREGGTGLGLAVCHGIVKDHDGWMEIADAPGGGALFEVYLPPCGSGLLQLPT
jgi:signal transduction histidine kinase